MLSCLYSWNKWKVRSISAAVIACILSTSVCSVAFAGGDNAVREYYTLSTSDGRDLILYEYPDMNAPGICHIPSGTEARIIRGTPEGWMLIEYKGMQGFVLDGELQILCSGLRM